MKIFFKLPINQRQECKTSIYYSGLLSLKLSQYCLSQVVRVDFDGADGIDNVLFYAEVKVGHVRKLFFDSNSHHHNEKLRITIPT